MYVCPEEMLYFCLLYCHSERSEESARGYLRFFAALRMTANRTRLATRGFFQTSPGGRL